MQVIYNHPSLPPIGIELGKIYDVVVENEVFYINNIKFEKNILEILFEKINKSEDIEVDDIENIEDENIE